MKKVQRLLISSLMTLIILIAILLYGGQASIFSETLSSQSNEFTDDEIATKLIINYHRPDQNYFPWSLWLWPHEPESNNGTQYQFNGYHENGYRQFELDLSGTDLENSTKIGVIVRQDNWTKDVVSDLFIDMTRAVSGGVIEVFLNSKEEKVYYADENFEAYSFPNGIFDFKFAPADLKNQFFGEAERWLLENQVGGIPMWASSSFTLFSSRMQLPAEEFVPVMGFGVAFGSMSEDDSTVIMDDGRPGVAGEFIYRTRLTFNPTTFNQWIAEDANSSDVIATFLDGLYYFGYNSDFSGFEVKPSMADGMPSPVDSTIVFGTTVSNVWSVPVRSGLRWTYNEGTDTSDFPEGHEVINAQSFVDTYKLAVDLGWFRAIGGGGDFLNPSQRIKNMQEYIDGDADWSEVGIRAEGNNIIFEFVPQMSEWNVIYWLSGNTLSPINLALYDAVGEQYGTSAETTAYNGRFYLQTYEPDRVLRVRRNPNFHDQGRNFYTGYNFEIIEDSEIAFQSFLAGRLDAIGLTPARFEEFENDSRLRSAPGATVFRMNINALGSVENQRAEFPDGSWIPEPILGYAEMHRALFFGLDRETIAYDVMRTAEPAMYYFTPAYLVDPSGGVSFRASEFGPAVLRNLSPDTNGFNPDAATALFRSAVRQAVADGHYAQNAVINLHLGIQSPSPAFQLAAEFIKEAYEGLFTDPETGISVVVDIQPEPFPQNYFNVILPGEFDLGFGGISGSTLNAASFLNVFRSGPGRSAFVLNFGPAFDTEEPVIPIEYVDPVSGDTKRELWSLDAIYFALTTEVFLVNGRVVDSNVVDAVKYTKVSEIHNESPFDSEWVKFEGTVVDRFRDGFIVWDGTYNLVIYNTNFGQPLIGEKVQVTGKYKTFHSLHQISEVIDITVLSRNNPLDVSTDISFDAFFESSFLNSKLNHGKSLRFEGQIVNENSGIYLKDFNSNLRIRISTSSNKESLDVLVSNSGLAVKIDLRYYSNTSTQGPLAIFTGLENDLIKFTNDDSTLLQLDKNVLQAMKIRVSSSDLSLPTSGPNGTEFNSWNSSHPDLINDQGQIVTFPSLSTNIIFTGTGVKGDLTTTVSLNVEFLVLESILSALDKPTQSGVIVQGRVVDVVTDNRGFFIFDGTGHIFIRDVNFFQNNNVQVGQIWQFKGVRDEFRSLPQVYQLEKSELLTNLIEIPSEQVNEVNISSIVNGNVSLGALFTFSGRLVRISGRFIDIELHDGASAVRVHHQSNQSIFSHSSLYEDDNLIDGKWIEITGRPFHRTTEHTYIVFTGQLNDIKIFEPNNITEENLVFRIDANNATLLGYENPLINMSSLVIPKTVTFEGNLITVNAIANNAFSDNYFISSVNIPQTIQSIGSRAFANTVNLIDLTFEAHSQLKEIGAEAFRNSNLNLLELPNGIETIRNRAFAYNHSLNLVFIPSSVNLIENQVFQNHSGRVTNVIIHPSTNMSEWDPSWISGQYNILYSDELNVHVQDHLKYLVLGDEAQLIGLSNDYQYENLQQFVHKYINVDGNQITVTSIGSYALTNRDFDSNQYTLNIPNTIVTIGAFAFQNVWHIHEIIFEANSQLKSIEEGAFIWNNFHTIHLPSSLKYLSPGAIYNWGLQEVNISNNDYFKSIDGVLYSSDSKTLYVYPTQKQGSTFVLPDSVETIAAFAFYLNRNLRTIEFTTSSALKTIGRQAFSSTNFSSIIFPEGLETIETYAFWWSRSLSLIYLPSSLINIESYAFGGVQNATFFTPLSSARSGWDSNWNPERNQVRFNFSDEIEITTINNLRYLIIDDNATVLGFESSPQQDINLLIPSSITHSGQQLTVNAIGASAFSQQWRIRQLTIPSTIVEIGAHAFSDAWNLNKINFEENSSLLNINESAFQNTALKTVLLPNGLTNIGNRVFNWNRNLSVIFIPQTVTRVGRDLFNHWDENYQIDIFVETGTDQSLWNHNWNPRNYTINQGSAPNIIVDNELLYLIFSDNARLLGYESYDFNNQHNQAMVNLEIPSHITYEGIQVTLTSIAASAFRNVQTLQKVTIPRTIERIESSAFESSWRLEQVVFEEGSQLKIIGSRAFHWNDGITIMQLPEGLERIEADAFSYMSRLQVLEIPSSVVFVGHNAVQHWQSNQELLIVVGEDAPMTDWNTNWNPRGFEVIRGTGFIQHQENNLRYLVRNGEATLQGFVERPNVNAINLTIPSHITVNGISYPVSEIRGNAFTNHSGVIETLFIPYTIQRIGHSAFRHNWRLRTVTFEAGSQLNEIGNFAFSSTSNLQTFTIPNSVTVLGAQPIDGWSLRTIEVEAGNTHFKIVSGALLTYDLTTLITYPRNNENTEFTLPKEVVTIGERAFADNQRLTRINIHPNSQLETIKREAFFNSSIVHLILPQGLKTIEDSALQSSSLTLVYLPNSLINMGMCIFSTNLDIYTNFEAFPTSETWNEEWCSNPNVTFGFEGKIRQENINNLSYLIVDDKATLLGYVQRPQDWVVLDIPSNITLSDNTLVTVTAIAARAFRDVNIIRSLTIPNTIQSIGNSAFRGLWQLEELTFSPGSQLTHIGQEVFMYNSYLKRIELPNGLLKIGAHAFAYMSSLQILEIPASVTTVERSAVRQNHGSNGLIIVANSEEQVSNWGPMSNWNPQNLEIFYGAISIQDEGALRYIIRNGEASVLGFVNRPTEDVTINIPNYIANGTITVNAIGSNAFRDIHQVRSVIIGKNVETIGESAFRGIWNLEQVTFEAGSRLYRIGSRAFHWNGNLFNLDLPESLEIIAEEALSGLRALSSLTFGDNPNLRLVGPRAFSDNRQLTSINIPASVTHISGSAFSNMETLVEINVDTNNNYFSSEDGVLFNKDKSILISFPSNYANTTYNVPASVVEIGSGAFRDNRKLSEITFAGDNLTTIREEAFMQSHLQLINFPTSLNRIERNAFYWMNRMSMISIPANVTTIQNNAFGGFGLEIYVAHESRPGGFAFNWNGHDTSVIFGQELTFIIENNMRFASNSENQATFLGLTNDYDRDLTTLVIPNSISNESVHVTIIGTGSLMQNSYIKEVIIPNSIISIRDRSFRDMQQLERVVFSENSKVQTIGWEAYANTGIVEMQLPDSLREIRGYAFAWNHRLTYVSIPKEVHSLDWDVFAGGNEAMIIMAEIQERPSGWNPQWLGWNNWEPKTVLWGTRADIVVQDDFRFILNSNNEAILLDYSTSNEAANIEIPSSISSTSVNGILNGAFRNHPHIQKVKIPSSVKYIQANAFRNAHRLTEVEFDEESQLKEIGSRAFENSNLLTFALPNSVESIGMQAFARNYRLRQFIVSENSLLKTIGERAFEWSYDIETLFIPQNVETIGQEAFRGLYNLQGFIVSENNENFISIDDVLYNFNQSRLIAFPRNRQVNREEFELPKEVEIVGRDAFRDAWSLNVLTFENSEKALTIESFAFAGSGIRELTLPDRLETIRHYGFAWMHQLRSVVIPSTVQIIENNAFEGGNSGLLIFVRAEQPGNLWSSRWNSDQKTVLFGNVVFVEDELFRYVVTEDSETSLQTARILSRLDNVSYENITMPSTVNHNGNSISVTAISSGLFESVSTLNSIIIPATIEEIGRRAFSWSWNLQSITFEENSQLKTIRADAFSGNRVREIIIPASVTRIEQSAFSNMWDLRTVTFEEGSQLATLRSHSFAWNHQLESFTIPESVSRIEHGALSGNHNLREINVVSGNAFYASIDGVLYNANQTTLISYPAGITNTSFNMPDSVTRIEQMAFRGAQYLQTIQFTTNSALTVIAWDGLSATGLRNITLPSSLIRIEGYAFAWNHRLGAVSIPDSVSYVGWEAFAGANPNLIIFLESTFIPTTWDRGWNRGNLTVVPGGLVEIIEDGDLSYMVSSGSALVFGTANDNTSNNIVIPSTITHNSNTITVTSILSSAFENNQNIQSVTIPNTIETINSFAFRYSALKEVTFEANSQLRNIGLEAFNHSQLRSVTIPASVQFIRDFAFSGNYQLTQVAFEPDSQLQQIGRYGFAWNYQLTDFTFPDSLQVIESFAFNNTAITQVAFGENSQIRRLESHAFAWSYQIQEVQLPASVEVIQGSVFRGSSSIQSFNVASENTLFTSENGVLFNKDMTHLIAYPNANPASSYVIPDSVTHIISDAFRNSWNLREVTFNENSQLETIGRDAFANSGLRSISLPSSLKLIEDYAFMWSWNLNEVRIRENSDLRIGYFAFRGINRNAVIRYEAETIPTSRFNSQWNPDRIFVILGSQEVFTEGVFRYAINFDNEVTLLGFNNGTSDENVNIPANTAQGDVLRIAAGAFENTTIASVVIPNTVIEIGEGAFKNTFSLNAVTLNEGLMLIGQEAFANSGINNLSIPSSVITIGAMAFVNNSALVDVSMMGTSQLESIGEFAFAWNASISTYELPASLSDLAENAFMGNVSLTSITIDSANESYQSLEGVLYNKGMTRLIQYPAGLTNTAFTVPTSVTSIADFAMRGSQFNTITLPDNLKLIGEYVFIENSHLTSLTIPSSVNFVGTSIINESNANLTTVIITEESASDWDEGWNQKANLSPTNP